MSIATLSAVSPCRTLKPAGVANAHWKTLLLTLVLASGGCSESGTVARVPVAGVISVDGVPLTKGVVRFIPSGATSGPAAVASVINGKFELPRSDGPVPGTHRVEIEAVGFEGFAIDDDQAVAKRIEQGKKFPRNPLPPVYNRESRLTLTLSEEGNENLEFNIVTKPGAAPRS